MTTAILRGKPDADAIKTLCILGLELLFAAVAVAEGSGETDKIRVACVGDSITWGYAMTNRVEECYPAQLQRILGDGYEVINCGDSGSCVYLEPMATKSGWRPHPWRKGHQAQKAYGCNPDIVVSALGANDSLVYMNEFTYVTNGIPVTEPGLFRRTYADILKEFAVNGRMPRIILWTKLAPLDSRHREHLSPAPFVMRFDLETVAKTIGAETLDMYTPLLPYAETEHFAKDGCHPEGGAQRIIAEITAEAILGKVH